MEGIVKTIKLPTSKWLRGEGSTRSYLRRPDDGRMCCLGILLSCEGVPETHLTNVTQPADVERLGGSLLKETLSKDVLESLFDVNQGWQGNPYLSQRDYLGHIMSVNDMRERDITDEDRVEELNRRLDGNASFRFELEKDD